MSSISSITKPDSQPFSARSADNRASSSSSVYRRLRSWMIRCAASKKSRSTIASKAPSTARIHHHGSKACCRRHGGCMESRRGLPVRVRRRAAPVHEADERESRYQRRRQSRPSRWPGMGSRQLPRYWCCIRSSFCFRQPSTLATPRFGRRPHMASTISAAYFNTRRSCSTH